MALKTKKDCYEFLKSMSSVNSDSQAQILKQLNDDGIHALCECVYNVLSSKKNVTRAKRIAQSIRNKKKEFRYLSKKNKPIVQKRQKLKSVLGKPLSVVLKNGVAILKKSLDKQPKNVTGTSR